MCIGGSLGLMNIIMENFPYRFVEVGTLENGRPDCRIQKADAWTKRYRDMYLCDNELQMMTAIEDKDYCLWLDSDNPPCYTRDRVVNPNK